MKRTPKELEDFLRRRQHLVDFLFDLRCLSEETWEDQDQHHEGAKWVVMNESQLDRLIRGH